MPPSRYLLPCTCQMPWAEQEDPCYCQRTVIDVPNTASDQRAMEQPNGDLANGFDLD
jgi:hypothetical protein